LPAIKRFDGFVITLYYNDHSPPHVHVRGSGLNARITIPSGEVLSGSLTGSRLRMVQGWVRLNEDHLVAAWEEATGGRRIETSRFIDEPSTEVRPQ
jgi:hypothetical protein